MPFLNEEGASAPRPNVWDAGLPKTAMGVVGCTSPVRGMDRMSDLFALSAPWWHFVLRAVVIDRSGARAAVTRVARVCR